MKQPKLPFVQFYGKIPGGENTAYTLIPTIPAIEVKGMLIATTKYEWTTDKDGFFRVDVLGTNVGVSETWRYRLVGGGKVFLVGLPYGVGPVSFKSLVQR